MNNSTSKRFQTDTQRRTLFMGGSALAAAFFVTRAPFAASEPPNTTRIGDIAMQGVHFDNNGIRMAGNVYFPPASTRAGNTRPSSASIPAAA